MCRHSLGSRTWRPWPPQSELPTRTHWHSCHSISLVDCTTVTIKGEMATRSQTVGLPRERSVTSMPCRQGFECSQVQVLLPKRKQEGENGPRISRLNTNTAMKVANTIWNRAESLTPTDWGDKINEERFPGYNIAALPGPAPGRRGSLKGQADGWLAPSTGMT